MLIDIHPEKSTCKVITFPVYPHIKKFIYRFYSLPEGDIELDRFTHTSLHVAMAACIRSKRKKKTARDEYSGTERYTEKLTISLTSRLSKQTLINPIVVRFSNEFDKVFKEAFYQWIIAQDNAGINNSEAIRSFKAHYNISEEDYSTENFRRLWTRYRQYKKN